MLGVLGLMGVSSHWRQIEICRRFPLSYLSIKTPDFTSMQIQLAVKILPSIDFFGVKWTEVAQIRIVKVPFPNPVVQNLERRKDFRVINPPTQLRIRKLRELPGMRAFPGESRNPEKCHVIANNSKNPDPFRYSVTVNVNPV